MNRRIWHVTTAAFLVPCCFLSAQSASGGTVTVVIHGQDPMGFGGPLWDMGQELFTYWDAQPGRAVEYRYEKSTLGLTAVRGVTGNANKIIVFDWASESDRWQGGYDEAAGDALFAMLAANNLLDSDYLHLIGHSRGAIVASQAARRIVHYGHTLNQLTLLDSEPGPVPLNKAGPAFAWEGIGLVDNYYGSGTWYEGWQLKGEPIAGAYNVYMDKAHEAFPQWYTATIKDPNATNGYFWRINDQSNAIPTGSPTPVIPPPDVINGDFNYGVVEFMGTGLPAEFSATTIAGWDYHGGGGTGHVDTPPYWLELDWDNDLKSHNWLFAPEDAVSLLFTAKVSDSSFNDLFYVDLETLPWAPSGHIYRMYRPLSLQSETDWRVYAVHMSEFAGSVFRFTFLIWTDGWYNPVDSEVLINDVWFEHKPVPEPSSIVLLSMGALTLTLCWWRRRRAA